MEWSQEEERALLSGGHIWGTARPAMGNSFSLRRFIGNDRKWKLPLPLVGTGAPDYASSHIWTSHTRSLWKNKEQEQRSGRDNFWFCFHLLEMLCVALNDHAQKAGLVFSSWLEKGCALIRENLENTKGQKSRIGITEKTILQRLLLFIWASFRSLGWEDPLEEEMATHSSVLAWRILDRGAC